MVATTQYAYGTVIMLEKLASATKTATLTEKLPAEACVPRMS